MKNSLQLKLKQQLRLTPQLQQAIKLLQLSAIELQQALHSALEDNPLLEIQEEQEPVDTHTVQSNPSLEKASSDTSENTRLDLNEVSSLRWEDQYANPVDHNWDEDAQSNNSSTESLQEQLSWQLNLSSMTKRDKFIAQFIIDAVKPNGRLSETLEQLFQAVPQYDKDNPIEFEEFEVVRHFIQQLTPVGCASTGLQDCLLSQLKNDHPHYATCKKLIAQHLDLLSVQDTKKISRLTHIPVININHAVNHIKSMSPYPGDAFLTPTTNYIIPDIILRKQQGLWKLELNQDITPTITLNATYLDILEQPKETPTKDYLKDKLQEAKTFINSLENRNTTLLKVSQAILETQLGFFEEGPHMMRPLTLQNIADHVEMHESTISRVTTQKYMRTPKGTFELKYFFSAQLGNAENNCSSTAIQAMIKNMIKGENPKKPLSDNKLAQEIWASQKIKVARRTISNIENNSLYLRLATENVINQVLIISTTGGTI